ncbi:glycosyltransferase [bacterium]|nr:MAG: glycosyltransferase [bacterium]
MYISEVSGHHNATLAIEKALKILEPEAEIINLNAFNYTNPISEKVVNHIYMGVIKRIPVVWDYLYDNPAVVKKVDRLKEIVHRFNSPKLKNLFDRFRPDVVICTQAFPCGMVSDYKKTFESALPLIAVLTDYIPHSYWIYDNVNYYIVPSDEVGTRLQKKGVSATKIKAFGIPFDPGFNAPIERDKILENLKLDAQLPNILIMGGSQGLGPIKTIIKSLEKVKIDFQEIIITGTNKKLYKSLKRKIKKLKKTIRLFSYINNINELMGIANIIITKPGGVTTAEALSKKIPMIIVKPIPGQEANNASYLVERGAAVKTEKPTNIHHIVENLLKSPERLKHMSESAEDISKPNASLDIAKLILSQ